jgi:hypothetical protein
LEGACRKLTRQQFYNAKHTIINHFSTEKLHKKAVKHEIVENPLEVTVDDYMAVSRLLMRLHVAARLQLHYPFFT